MSTSIRIMIGASVALALNVSSAAVGQSWARKDRNEPRAREASPRGLEEQTITVGGVDRTYYLHAPRGRRSERARPLVLVLHGGGKGDGMTVAKSLGFTQLADRHGFVVAYPNGIDAQWNDGRGETYSGDLDASVDDVGFISALIDELVRTERVDPDRVYVTGISNGGMMTLRLGCELSDKLAAIAPIAANIPANIVEGCEPERALPVLVMNGTADPLVPWEGGEVHFGRKTMGEVVSTAETVGFWVERDGCGKTPSVRELPDRDTGDNSTVRVSTYAGGEGGSEVVLYAIEGGGHTLPGSAMPDIERLFGAKNMDIDGAAVIWDFFEKHTR